MMQITSRVSLFSGETRLDDVPHRSDQLLAIQLVGHGLQFFLADRDERFGSEGRRCAGPYFV
jgi:hypothetical protein